MSINKNLKTIAIFDNKINYFIKLLTEFYFFSI